MLLRPVHVIYNEINSPNFACLLVHGVIVVTSNTVAVPVASSLRRGWLYICVNLRVNILVNIKSRFAARWRLSYRYWLPRTKCNGY